jgi:CheY-like chemotaxis protein
MDKIEIQQLISFSKSINVLYVEDNQEARSQTIKVLENFFSNIIIGIDGLDGLEKFKNNKIDLIITDINMPKLNGLDMIEQIKKIDNEVFCLVISAYNETEHLLKAIELGVDGFLLSDFLRKPSIYLPNACLISLSINSSSTIPTKWFINLESLYIAIVGIGYLSPSPNSFTIASESTRFCDELTKIYCASYFLANS